MRYDSEQAKLTTKMESSWERNKKRKRSDMSGISYKQSGKMTSLSTKKKRERREQEIDEEKSKKEHYNTDDHHQDKQEK